MCFYVLYLWCLIPSVLADYAYYDNEKEAQNTNINLPAYSLYIAGYKAVAGSSGSITAGSADFQGDRAAYEVSSITTSTGTQTWCLGTKSCSKVSQSTAHWFQCGGSNSCSFSKLTALSNFIRCVGDQSCAHSNITIHNEIRCHAAYSCLFSKIETEDTSQSVSLFCDGYYSCFGAILTCKSSDTCTINCYGNGCYMMEMQCPNSNCIVNANNTTIEPITNATLFNSSFDPLIYYDSNAISDTVDTQCNSVTATSIDSYVDGANPPSINITTADNAPLCCRAGSSCFGQGSLTVDINRETTLVCGGRTSCMSSQFKTSHMENTNGSVFCGGYQSCNYENTQIKATKNIYCNAFESCRSATIYGEYIFCSGENGCSDSKMYSDYTGNMNVYLLGKNSGSNANIYCREGDECMIKCASYSACNGAVVHCAGQCTVDCDEQQYPYCPQLITSAPTFSPTDATTNPTINPTTYPTFNPTFNPTFDPTFNPTNIPTFNPTFNPTFIPTNIPTFDPTFNPTKIPTFNPTFDPTFIPTNVPTKNPTFNPTNAPTKTSVAPTRPPGHEMQLSEPTQSPTSNPTTQMQRYRNYKTVDRNVSYPILEVIAGFLTIIIISACIYSKIIKVNDFFSVVALITASLHILDMASDILFSVHIFNTVDSDLLFLFGLSIIFIVFPLSISLYQLHYTMNNKWMKSSNEVKGWIKDNITLLFFLSVLSGSSFTAIDLCHSNLFNLNQFDIPLCKTEIRLFKTQRIYSIIMFENIPQIALQCWFIFGSGLGDKSGTIVYVSLVFSFISILVTVVSLFTQKTVINMMDYVELQFDVVGANIYSKTFECRNIVQQPKREIAGILGINNNLTEILRPIKIPNGLQVKMKLYISISQAIDMNCQQLMKNATNDGKLQNMFKSVWSLSSVPNIKNIKCVQMFSKQRTENTVNIPLDSEEVVEIGEIKQMQILSEPGNDDLVEGNANNINFLAPQISQVIQYHTSGNKIKSYDSDSSSSSNSGNNVTAGATTKSPQ